jgi:hypothetical protein
MKDDDEMMGECWRRRLSRQVSGCSRPAAYGQGTYPAWLGHGSKAGHS